MPKYDVHIFPVVRVRIAGVEAESQEAAIRKALASVNLEQVALHPDDYADDIVDYLVDEHGDSDHDRSRHYLDTNHLRCLRAWNTASGWPRHNMRTSVGSESSFL